jgi:hypothetical protein
MNKFISDWQEFRIASQVALFAWVIVTFAAAGFIATDLYALNRGFSFGDESYYALSYKMAAQGFYPHFTNTPFLIAPVFEWLKPDLVFYRAMHLILVLGVAILLVLAIARYLTPSTRSFRNLILALLPFAICYAPYSYYLSAPALSYNHLNEVLVLASEASLLLAARSKQPVWLCFLAGALTVLDIYVKPPTFIQLGFVNIAAIVALFWHSKPWRHEIPSYLLGGGVIFSLMTAFVVTPADWLQYLAFMHSHQTHHPVTVLLDFLKTGWRMIAQSGPYVAITLFALASLCRYPRNRQTSLGVIAGLLIMFLFVAYRTFKLTDNPILGNCWAAWGYTSTLFVAISVIFLGSALMALWSSATDDRKKFLIVLSILAINPIIISLGTLNGFGQVQLVGLSWFLIGGIAFFLLRRATMVLPLLYLSLLLVGTVALFATYYARQWMPMNPLGEGALLEQVYPIPDVPALQHLRVDAETRNVLIQTNAVLQHYPTSPVVTFFDIPGLQYAFARPWVIRDPWLSSTEVPRTRDDAYNCGLFTSNAALFHNSIFMVANEDAQSNDLKSCLSTIGFPKQLISLGQIMMPVFAGGYSVNLYLYP